MHVVVGSTNPVKRRAVEQTLEDQTTSVSLCAVDSDVSDQPWGHAMTLKGAQQRAQRSFERSDATIGIGLEGGVCTHEFTDGLFVIMWAVATNGQRTEDAAGPQFRLPQPVATKVQDGEELGPVLDEYLGTEGTKFEGGAAAVVTDGLSTRSAAMGQAVAGAVGPLLSSR